MSAPGATISGFIDENSDGPRALKLVIWFRRGSTSVQYTPV